MLKKILFVALLAGIYSSSSFAALDYEKWKEMNLGDILPDGSVHFNLSKLYLESIDSINSSFGSSFPRFLERISQDFSNASGLDLSDQVIERPTLQALQYFTQLKTLVVTRTGLSLIEAMRANPQIIYFPTVESLHLLDSFDLKSENLDKLTQILEKDSFPKLKQIFVGGPFSSISIRKFAGTLLRRRSEIKVSISFISWKSPKEILFGLLNAERREGKPLERLLGDYGPYLLLEEIDNLKNEGN
jgi:hypothetical protein